MAAKKAAAAHPTSDTGDVVVDAVRTKFGDDSITRLGAHQFQRIETTSSGSLALDKALGSGGYARGRIIELFGVESCLDGDTVINYTVRLEDGRRIANSKGGTLRRLWERFHHKNSGKGKYQRDATLGAKFYAPSLNEEDRVFQNQVLDVVCVGTRECFRLCTLGGMEIVGTVDHRFFDGSKYVRLGDLEVGQTVLVHNCTPFRREPVQRAASRRAQLYVKHHPIAGTHVVSARISRETDERREYVYKRLQRSRAVVEASMNGLTLEGYVDRLDAGELVGLRFLERDDHVHHLDEDEGNDALENLVVLSAAEHGRIHALERHNNLRFVATEDVVASIEPVGLREVFDIKMAAPFNNFVAGGFCTHNSGKTTLALHALAEVQRLGEQAAFVDAEHALDPQYAKALGVNIERLLFSQPQSGEQALDIVQTLIETGDVSMVVIDSVAALTPLAEQEGDMSQQHVGVQARMMSKAMRKLAGAANTKRCTLLFINQIRMKIGVMYGNPETTPGGNALKFFASQRLDVRRREHVKEGDDAIGNMINVKIVKNKTAPPFEEASVMIRWGQGIDRAADLLTAAVELGVVLKAGAWYSYAGEKLAQGFNSSATKLLESKELRSKVYAETRAALGLV